MSKKKRTAAQRVAAALVALVVALMPLPTGGVALADGYPTSGKVELRDIRYSNSVTTPEGEAMWRQPRVGDMAICTVTVRNTSMNPLNKTDAKSGLTDILSSLGLDDGQGWGTLTFTSGSQTSSSGSSVSLNWSSGLRHDYTTSAIEVVLPVTEEVLESATVGGGALAVTVDRSFWIEPKVVSIVGLSPAEGQAWADVLPVFKEGDEVTVEMALKNTGNVACTAGVVGMSAGWPESSHVDSAGDTCYKSEGNLVPIGTLEPDGTTTVSVTFPWRAAYDEKGITFFMGTEYADADGAPWVKMSGSTGIYRSMLAHTAEAPTVSVRRVGDTSKPVLNGDTVTFALDLSVPEGNTVGFRVPSPSFNVSMSGYQVGYGTDDDPFSVTWSNDVVAPGETRSVYVSFTASDGHVGPSDGIVRLDTRDERDCHAQTVEASGVALDYDPNPMAATVHFGWYPSMIWGYGEGVMFPGESKRVQLSVENTGACPIAANSPSLIHFNGNQDIATQTIPVGGSYIVEFPSGPSGTGTYIAPTAEQIEAGVWTGTVTLSAEGKEPQEVPISIELLGYTRWNPVMAKPNATFDVKAGDVIEVPYAVSYTSNRTLDVTSEDLGQKLSSSSIPVGDDDTWETVGETVLAPSYSTTTGTTWVRRITVTQEMVDGGALPMDDNHSYAFFRQSPSVSISASRAGSGNLREGDEAEFEVVVVNTGNTTLSNCDWATDGAPAISLSVNGEEVQPAESSSAAGVYTYTVDFDDILRDWQKENGVSPSKSSDNADDEGDGTSSSEDDSAQANSKADGTADGDDAAGSDDTPEDGSSDSGN